MIRSCLLAALVLYCSAAAYAQKAQIFQASVVYKEPPSRKLPETCKTYQVYCTSFLAAGYQIYPGPLALLARLYPLQRVLNDSADLRLQINVGNPESPALVDPAVNDDGYTRVVSAGIYLPLYYKLTDAKGMIYEEDSSNVSADLPYVLRLPYAHTDYIPSVSAYGEALMNAQWEQALRQNVADINNRLNEMFFGADKQVPTRLFAFGPYEKFGFAGDDKAVLTRLFAALGQFSEDQQWAPLAEQCALAATYWKALLEKTKTAWQALSSKKERQRLTNLQYDIYFNLAQCAIWSRNSNEAMYFINQCSLLPQRDNDTRELVANLETLSPSPVSRRF
ncbi:MAG TPA: hypothetical protein VGC22_08770 [Chitinophaga sp.]